ncbi:MAG: hypothetical protein VX899_07415 [Myxococcota bacterium]|nr:hypothetical protein [Myxococcota bacterium]
MKAKARQGQSTVEYMLLISLVSVAVIAAMLSFSDTVQVNTRALSDNLSSELTGQVPGDQVK